jgi:hypothetical protein
MGEVSSEPMLLCPHSLVDPSRSSRGLGRAEEQPIMSASFRAILACVDGPELESVVITQPQLVARALGTRLTLLQVLETEVTGTAPPDPLDWGIRLGRFPRDRPGGGARI